jgi:maltose O-acetyltransferase
LLKGELYDPLDPAIVQARDRARDLCQDLNATREEDAEVRRRILKALFGRGGDSVWVQPPFFCDYGSTTRLG